MTKKVDLSWQGSSYSDDMENWGHCCVPADTPTGRHPRPLSTTRCKAIIHKDVKLLIVRKDIKLLIVCKDIKLLIVCKDVKLPIVRKDDKLVTVCRDDKLPIIRRRCKTTTISFDTAQTYRPLPFQ
ncbi:hypothetical protein L208DRAFT_293021 [Tricholoma matsutake]|nr:hypothetical protein L208DRAFT_293021 [Tricholoma matsutake 945]